MTYVWLTWLPDALIAAGCKVRTEDGWKNRGRPSSTGAHDPYAVLWHHTATHASYDNPHPTLRMCIEGRPDLPGPLCHVLIGYDGTCHVIAAGRANHAGDCNGAGPTYKGDGNEQLVGFEIDYDGSQEMSREQYDAAIKAAAGVVRHLGHDESYCLGHKETSTTGKWDPGGYNLNVMRQDVAKHLAGKWGDDDMPNYLSLSGPGFTLAESGDWTPVKFNQEASDSGDVHSEGYAWLNELGRYTAQVRVDITDAQPDNATLIVRWAKYDTSSGEFLSSAMSHELPLTTGGTGAYNTMIGTVGKGQRVRVEVKARGGTIQVGSAGLSGLYWPT